VPGDHKRDGPSRREGAAQSVPPGTRESLPFGGHCPDCRCRCRCHTPLPEPPVAYTPPRPGAWEWSGYLAELSADLGSLEAAYAAVDPRMAA
jgi:hypothetical protein